MAQGILKEIGPRSIPVVMRGFLETDFQKIVADSERARHCLDFSELLAWLHGSQGLLAKQPIRSGCRRSL